MLVNFTVKNWMSFKDSTTVCMAAGDDEFLNDRIPYLQDHKVNLLPIAAVFGGNASGKSNLLKAIDHARWLIINGPQNSEESIGLRPHKLDTISLNSPTEFNFVVLVNEIMYEFQFVAVHDTIIREKLSIIHPNSEEYELVYEREEGKKIEFSDKFESNGFVQTVATGVKANQLFLSFIGKIDPINNWPVYDWFKENLVIVLPKTKVRTEIFNEKRYQDAINPVLPKLDCGIVSIGNEDVTAKLDQSTLTKIKESLEKTNGAIAGHEEARLVVSEKDGELLAIRMVTFHQDEKGNLVQFIVQEESDGTVRILDLIPGFLDISRVASKKVYIIDEIDRSLHTNLSRNLLVTYLENCTTDSRSQLLFTTHDILLMDKFMLRRDEMHLTQRSKGGSTTINSLDEFETKDKKYELYKDYLNGRFGGIPDILLGGGDFSQDGKIL